MTNADVQRATEELRDSAEEIATNNPAMQAITFLIGLHAKELQAYTAEKLVAATINEFPLPLEDFDLLNSFHTELAQAFTDFNVKAFKTVKAAGIDDPFLFGGLR